MPSIHFKSVALRSISSRTTFFSDGLPDGKAWWAAKLKVYGNFTCMRLSLASLDAEFAWLAIGSISKFSIQYKPSSPALRSICIPIRFRSDSRCKLDASLHWAPVSGADYPGLSMILPNFVYSAYSVLQNFCVLPIWETKASFYCIISNILVITKYFFFLKANNHIFRKKLKANILNFNFRFENLRCKKNIYWFKLHINYLKI